MTMKIHPRLKSLESKHKLLDHQIKAMESTHIPRSGINSLKKIKLKLKEEIEALKHANDKFTN